MTVIVTTLVAVVLYVTPPTFAATIKILVTTQEEKHTDQVQLYQPLDREFFNTLVELVKSHRLAEQVVKRLNLMDRSAPRNPLNDLKHAFTSPLSFLVRKQAPASSGKPNAARLQLACARLQGAISTVPVRNTKILGITVEDWDREFVVKLAETIGALVVEQTVEIRRSDLHTSSTNLLDLLSQTQKKLAASEDTLRHFENENGASNLEIQVKHLVEKSSIELQSDLSAVDKSLAEEKARAAVLAKQMERVYSQSIIEGLRINANAAEEAIARWTNRRAEILRQKSEVSARIKQLLSFATRHSVLQRDVDVNQKLYDTLLLRQKEVSTQETTTTAQACIFEHALRPAGPIRPRKVFGVLVGLLSGLLSGLALGALLEYNDTTIRSREEIIELTKLPVLGTIPSRTQLARSDGPVELVALNSPNCAMAESFRALKECLQFVPLHSAALPMSQRAVVVASAQPAEGKSFITSNLAITLAQAGGRTVVVDCDLRRPRIASIFGMTGKPGLSEVGTVEDDQLIHLSRQANLWVVTAGGFLEQPGGFLTEAKVQEFLIRLMSKFDWVLFDSPPINLVSDALSLSRLAATILLVVGVEKVTRSQVKQTIEKLESVKARVGGLVVNNLYVVGAKPEEYYYVSN